MDLASMADQYRRAAHRAGLARDWLDDGAGTVAAAHSSTGVAGDNRLRRGTDESLAASRAAVEQHAARLHDFVAQCLWRAGEIDAYLARRGQAERARAAHMRAEDDAARREGREPTDRFAPSVPRPPHGWMRGS